MKKNNFRPTSKRKLWNMFKLWCQWDMRRFETISSSFLCRNSGTSKKKKGFGKHFRVSSKINIFASINLRFLTSWCKLQWTKIISSYIKEWGRVHQRGNSWHSNTNKGTEKEKWKKKGWRRFKLTNTYQ